MTEPTQPESTPEAGNQGLPVPTFSETSADKPTSQVDTKALAKEVADILRPELERTAQSVKDRRFAAIEKKLGMSDLAELREMGVEIPENVEMKYQLRQLMEQRNPQAPETPTQAPTSQGSGASLTVQDVSEVVKKFNLDANQADVMEALRGTYRNRDHFEASLANLAFAKLNKPQPSAAASPAMPSTPNPPSSPVDVSALSAEYSKLAKAPGKNAKRLKEIEDILNGVKS